MGIYNLDIPQTWHSLSEGQGTVIAALITVVAALSGVVLSWRLFGGRVKNLESALATTEGNVQGHIKVVENALAEYESKLNEQLSSFSLQIGQLSGSIADLPTQNPIVVEPVQQNYQDTIRENWARIRDRLEGVAADPKIDGRTRARYGRIDRRKYWDLVTALQNDGLLGLDGNFYKEAVDHWLKFRNGRLVPGKGDAQKMKNLADRLTGSADH